jgi:hypothetical protein
MGDLRMRGLLAGALVATAALVTSSCATMSPKQCQSADWQSIGYGDGVSGHPMSRIDDHAKACAKVAITPDPTLYAAGREEGLKRYCTEMNGFSEGRYGRVYYDVCPYPADAAFRGGYVDGERVYRAEQRLRLAKADLSLADQRADKRARQADGVEEELRNPKLTEEQTRELRDRLRRLRRERHEAIEDGRRAAAAIPEAEREVDDLKNRFGSHYGWW